MSFPLNAPLTDEQKAELEKIFGQPVNDVNEIVENFCYMLSSVFSDCGTTKIGERKYFVHLAVKDDCLFINKCVEYNTIMRKDVKNGVDIQFRLKTSRSKKDVDHQ